MDTGFSVRPVQPNTSVAPMTEVAKLRAVTRTELPPTQAVAAVADKEPVQFEENGSQQSLRAKLNRVIDAYENRTTLKVEQDEVTRDIVFRKVSPNTGEVVQQFPDEAVMRQRTYAAQQRRAELEQALMPGTEDHVSKVA